MGSVRQQALDVAHGVDLLGEHYAQYHREPECNTLANVAEKDLFSECDCDCEFGCVCGQKVYDKCGGRKCS